MRGAVIAMPYVDLPTRHTLDPVVAAVVLALQRIGPDRRAGALNYVISRVLFQLWGELPSYRLLNEAMGILMCAAQEFYRRVVAPYEDQKCEDHGDVFPR